MEADLAQFREQGAEILAVAVQDRARAQAAADTMGVSYPILADPDHRVAEAYGVFNLLGDNIAAPAVFIINQAGQITWSYIGQNANDRPDSQALLANLPSKK